jgi:hypothetical protein
MRLDVCDKLMLDDGMKRTGLSASGFVRFCNKIYTARIDERRYTWAEKRVKIVKSMKLK